MNPPQGQRKCRHCHRSYLPDLRNRYHQQYCPRPECQRASKRASQLHWLKKRANRDYFCGPEHVKRVQEWRKQHPHYWRRHCRGGQCELETPKAQVTAVIDGARVPRLKSGGGTLQDFCRRETPLLMHVLAQLERGALQEDIVRFVRGLVTVGQCIPEQTAGQQEETINNYDAQPDLPFEPKISPAVCGCRHPEMVGTGAGPPLAWG